MLMRIDEVIRENRDQVMRRLLVIDRRCGTLESDQQEGEKRKSGRFRVGWGDWGAWDK